MNRVDEKAQRELTVFCRFLARAGLPIDPASAEKRSPPEPDVLCRHRDEGPIAFELVENCDPEIASRLAPYRLRNADFFFTSDPTPDVGRKLRKNYETPHPIELLVYNAGRIVTPDDDVIYELRSIFETDPGPFRRVWFSGEKQVYLIHEK